jgi:prepilin peptidase CpaA
MTPYWQFGLVGILAVAVTTDLQNRKIYNWLTFPAMLAGLMLNGLTGGLHGLGSAAIGFLAAALVFAIGFFLNSKAMGAGDVKLMAAVGAWLGWPGAFAAVIYVTIIGAIVAIVTALRAGVLVPMLRNVYQFMFRLAIPGGEAGLAFEKSAAPPVPYGVSITLGTMLALFYPQVDDLLRVLHLH